MKSVATIIALSLATVFAAPAFAQTATPATSIGRCNRAAAIVGFAAMARSVASESVNAAGASACANAVTPETHKTVASNAAAGLTCDRAGDPTGVLLQSIDQNMKRIRIVPLSARAEWLSRCHVQLVGGGVDPHRLRTWCRRDRLDDGHLVTIDS